MILFYLNRPFSFFLIFLVSLLVALRPIGFDRDSPQYLGLINSDVGNLNWIEPFFFIFRWINNYFYIENGFLVFFLFCFVGLTLKLYAFYKLTPYYLISFYLYLFSFFFLLEMTQIRVAAALGFVFLAFACFYNKNNFCFLLYIFFASLFHYSSIICLLFYFFWGLRNSKALLILLPLMGYILSFVLRDYLVINYVPSFLSQKISHYISMTASGSPLFSLYRLLSIFMYYLFLYFSFKIKDSRLRFFTVAYGLSIFFYYAFSSFPEVFSIRFSGIFSVFIVLLIPYAFKFFKEREFGFLFIPIYVYINLWYLFFHVSIFDFSVVGGL